MSLQAIASCGESLALQTADKKRQEVPDQAFAALLQIDTKTTVSGTLLTPSTEKVDAAAPKHESSKTTDATKEKTPAELFLEYMHKTPAQRWREAWLKQHGLTEEQFAALTPEKKQALQDQMEQDMKEMIKQTAEKKAKEADTV